MRTVLACAAVLVAMAMTTGAAAVEPRPRSVVVEPDWLARPTGADMERFYPFAASTLALEGRATISCAVEAIGKLKDCTVLSESPEGIGFGKAAIKLSSLFRMRPMTVAGRSVDHGVVRIPIRFQLPPKPEPQSMPEASPEALALARRLAAPRSSAPDAATQAEMWVNTNRYKLTADLDAKTAAKVTNAVRLGQEEVIPKAAELQAQVIASTVPLNELRANADFWASDIGRQISAKFEAIKQDQSRTMFDRMLFTFDMARQIFCKTHDCAEQADFDAAHRPKAAPGLVLNPEWAEQPDSSQVLGAYPFPAKIMGVGGQAGLLCERLQNGALNGCKVVAETPANLGFGAAGLRLAPYYRLRTSEASSTGSVWFVTPFKPTRFPPPVAKVEPATGPNIDLARKAAMLDTQSRLGAFDSATRNDQALKAFASMGETGETQDAFKAFREATRIWETTRIEPLVSLYAKTFTKDELKTYLAYRHTTAGRAWPERQAKVTATIAKLGPSVLGLQFEKTARARFCSMHPCEIEPAPALPKPEAPSAEVVRP